jgi:nicotinamidase-related amidase
MSSALLLVDLQNDFFADDELARCKEDVLAACNALIDKAVAAGAPVVEVQTVHAADKSTWALNMLEDGEGVAIEGTAGAERLEGLGAADRVVVKTRDSAFHGTDLAEWLDDHRIDAIVLAGVSTESCIAATAVDGYAHDLKVILVQDATASVDPELHVETLDRLRAQYRQSVVHTDEAQF